MSESGAELFARLDERRCVRGIEPRLFPNDGGPAPGEAVELYGGEGTGKTELLYHLLCRCLLPEEVGGLQGDVLFLDLDYGLDMFRLVSILDHHLNAGGLDEARLRLCLSRLLVVHCSSSSQLLLTLHSLETSVAARRGPALLIINSISAFYWLDRQEGGGSSAKQEEKLSKSVELLARLLRDYRITMFASCHAMKRGASSSSDPERPYLCRPWQQLVTWRMLCSRQDVPNAAAASGKEARTRRLFTVHCSSVTSSSSSSSSSSTASSSSSGAKTHRSCSFFVTDGGLRFV